MLRAWRGESGNAATAQAALLHRAAMNGAARRGTYRPQLEQPVGTPA